MKKINVFKKAITLVLALTLTAAVFAGCKKDDSKNNSNSDGGNKPSTATGDVVTTGNGADFKLVENQPIATITIKGFGDVKVALFPDIAPKAVENFTTHAKDGYYDGLKFHRIMANFMIQGGDPTGTGAGGESIWGKAFEDEFSDKAYNFSGALSMANSGANTNGSQFFIVNTPAVSREMFPLYQIDPANYSEDNLKKYEEVGGTPWLDGVHTVFGQVYEGLDIVQKIMEQTDSDPDTGMASEDVIIETIKISNYTK